MRTTPIIMLLILLTAVGFGLSNCGGSLFSQSSSSSTATSTGTSSSSATDTPTPTATATTAAQTAQMFVVSQSGTGVNGSAGPNVGVFPSGVSGNVAPAPALNGFIAPSGAAFDPLSNTLYVGDSGSHSVVLDMADGTQSTLVGPDSHPISNPTGVTVDSHGNLYVLSQAPGGAGFVQVYPPASQGNSAPSYTIEGSNTGMTLPFGIAVDAAENIFVGNSQNPVSGGDNGVLEFKAGGCPAGQTCNVAPAATITGSATQIDNVGGVALDSAGNIWVSDPQSISTGLLLEFNLSGCVGICNKAPIAKVTTGLAQPFGIAIDKHDQVYVANATGGDKQFGSVTVYSPTGALLTTIAGSETQLSSPVGIAIGAMP